MHRPHSKHLRKGRWSEADRPYLVTTRTFDRTPIFRNLFFGRILVNSLRWSDHRKRTRTWCFVVMPDHLHWLFTLGDATTLAHTVSSVKKFSAREINRLREERGPIWQDGYHDRAIRRDESLRQAARYVVTNPLRAGLVRSVRDYALWDARWLRGEESRSGDRSPGS